MFLWYHKKWIYDDTFTTIDTVTQINGKILTSLVHMKQFYDELILTLPVSGYHTQ